MSWRGFGAGIGNAAQAVSQALSQGQVREAQRKQFEAQEARAADQFLQTQQAAAAERADRQSEFGQTMERLRGRDIVGDTQWGTDRKDKLDQFAKTYALDEGRLNLGYDQLAQNANEFGANQTFTAKENAANRANQRAIAAMPPSVREKTPAEIVMEVEALTNAMMKPDEESFDLLSKTTNLDENTAQAMARQLRERREQARRMIFQWRKANGNDPNMPWWKIQQAISKALFSSTEEGGMSGGGGLGEMSSGTGYRPSGPG